MRICTAGRRSTELVNKIEEENRRSTIGSGRGPSFTFSFMDFLYIFFCLAGTLLCLGLFWRDLNQTLTRLAENPVGTISYKYRAAQRRFIDRLLWDRLKQESPVYQRRRYKNRATVRGDGKFLDGRQADRYGRKHPDTDYRGTRCGARRSARRSAH